MSKCQYCGLEFRNLDPRHSDICKEYLTRTDNKAPRELCPHCQGFDYREEHEINLKCLKENVKLQSRIEKCEGLLREAQKEILKPTGIPISKLGHDLEKYFAEVESERV